MKIFLLRTCLLAFGLINCNANYQESEDDNSARFKRSSLDYQPNSHYHIQRSSNSKQTQNIKPSFHAVLTFTYRPGSDLSYIKSNNEQTQNPSQILSKNPNKIHAQSNKDKSGFVWPNVNNDLSTSNDTPAFRPSDHIGNAPNSRQELTQTEKITNPKHWSYNAMKTSNSNTDKIAPSEGKSKKRRRGKRRKIKRKRISKTYIDIEEKTLLDFESVAVGSKQEFVNDDNFGATVKTTGNLTKAAIIAKSYKSPEINQQPYTKIKIYNLRLVINVADESGCSHCPGNKIIVAKKGMRCAPLLLPVITSCPNHGNPKNRPLRWSLHGNRTIGRILPEGSHTIVFRITSNSQVTSCSFKYHVKVNRCPIPKPVFNGAVDCTEGRYWGSRCIVKCNPGYFMIGNPISVCEGNISGVNWTEPFPVCREVDSCQKPEELVDGEVKCDLNNLYEEFISPGTICSYRCKTGYELSDTIYSVILCNQGKWNSSKTPICTVVRCEKPSDPENGFLQCIMNESVITSGTICRYVCKSGFVIPTNRLGGEFMECLGSEWNSSEAVECVKNIAPQPKANMCVDETLTTDELITKSQFITSSGEDAEVTCTFEGKFEPGVYENVCEATDPQLRSVATCVYMVEILEKSCDLPKLSETISIKCSKKVEMDDFYPIGTICHYECPHGQTIPTNQLEISNIRCEIDSHWNSTKIPTCKEIIPPTPAIGTCIDINLYLKDISDFELVIPKFITSTGLDAEVTCSVTNISDFDVFINHCTAWDPELRSSSSCRYEINLQELQCKSLTSPTNADMNCFMAGRKIYRCNFNCHSGYSFISDYDDLKKGFVECEVENGKWDFTERFNIDLLPDCLGESVTSFTTDLHFNATVYDCNNESSINEIQDNIKKGLLSRNQVICDQIDCTDFTYLCDQLRNGISILETIWNITANFTPQNVDDYYYEQFDTPEAENWLTEIQQNTNEIITSDEAFHLELSEVGATVLTESYKHGIIDLICITNGYVIDPETFKCLQCPTGTYYHGRNCLLCPLDTYQDETGQTSCKKCPDGAITIEIGSRMKSQCTRIQENALDQSHYHDPKCDPNPCRNGGVCFQIGSDDFTCFCTDGYEGNFCEFHQCPQGFCLNGGTCHYERGGYTCLCLDGTSGLKCEITNGGMIVKRVNANSCLSSPCMKGGICIQPKANDYYYCRCPKDRTGDHCENAACPDPYGQWFCINGGQCVILDDTHAMVCLCKDGFIGSRCEFPEDEFAEDISSRTLT